MGDEEIARENQFRYRVEENMHGAAGGDITVFSAWATKLEPS